MDNQFVWSDEEVKTLFKFIEIKKQEGVPLVKAFAQYATKTLRHANSVRNYYYKELASMLNDPSRAKKLEINLSNHSVTKSRPFSKEEETEMVEKIDSLKEQGYSVRRACLQLANGDVSDMIRLQNKYRSIIKAKEQPKSMGQIIKMPVKPERITDDELKALFLGLVRLVKKQEVESARALVENELFDANQKLKNAMEELAIKHNYVEKLKSELLMVKQELKAEKEKLNKLNPLLIKKQTANNVLKKYFDGQKSLKTQGISVKK